MLYTFEAYYCPELNQAQMGTAQGTGAVLQRRHGVGTGKSGRQRTLGGKATKMPKNFGRLEEQEESDEYQIVMRTTRVQGLQFCKGSRH